MNSIGGAAVKSETRAASPRFARQRAKKAGDKRYFSGRPCTVGHVAERITSNGWCVECASKVSNNWHTANPGKYRREHPAKFAMYKAKRRAAEKSPARASEICITAVYSIMKKLRAAGVDVNVDHVVPLSGRTVSGLHVRENLQIIPASENFRKPRVFIPA